MKRVLEMRTDPESLMGQWIGKGGDSGKQTQQTLVGNSGAEHCKRQAWSQFLAAPHSAAFCTSSLCESPEGRVHHGTEHQLPIAASLCRGQDSLFVLEALLLFLQCSDTGQPLMLAPEPALLSSHLCGWCKIRLKGESFILHTSITDRQARQWSCSLTPDPPAESFCCSMMSPTLRTEQSTRW